MNATVVGIADCRIVSEPSGLLVTYALGSCIAVAIHDPQARVAGLLHFMLPESRIDPAKAGAKPFMFADTGIPLLFRHAYERGAEKRRLSVRLAGGCQLMDEAGVFNIGKRNYLAARKILWNAGVLVQNEAVGGSVSRTVRLDSSSGRMWLCTAGQPDEELPAYYARTKGGPFGLGADRG
ncbi:MAG TPA: chemotaxis protein CheD [Bryobacteraceae bacterium]|nr:chemotaxis protein CheD [Bryobacteraceae bacterium]HUJ21751.1 chemotaxis protein CheD [Bryobacteraceae bacterium]